MQKKSTTPRQPQVKLISATTAGRSFTYQYRVGSETVNVTFGNLNTDSYFVAGERTRAVSAAVIQAQRAHSLLSL